MKTRRLINLDTASDRTLRRIAADPTDPRQHYASATKCARTSRLAGRIDQALKYERIADTAYHTLPDNLRW